MRLESLAMKQKWTKVNNLLKTKRGQRELQILSSRDNGVTPLVIAIIKKAPVKVVEKMLQIEPSLSIRKDIHGMTPLHFACYSGSPFSVILLLLQNYSNQIKTTTTQTNHDKDDHDIVSIPTTLQDLLLRTPLHHLLTYMCFPYHDDVENKSSSNAIYNSTYVSFQFTRGRESVPLTVIAPSSSSTAAADDPHASGSVGADGNNDGNVLNKILTQEEFDECLLAVDELLKYQPESLRLSDKNGRFPIDILHDFISCNYSGDTKSVSVERSRLLCRKLRKSSIQLYRSEKARCEDRQERREKVG